MHDLEATFMKMPLHDTIHIEHGDDHGVYVRRVVGGWIYSEWDTDNHAGHPYTNRSTCFVPEREPVETIVVDESALNIGPTIQPVVTFKDLAYGDAVIFVQRDEDPDWDSYLQAAFEQLTLGDTYRVAGPDGGSLMLQNHPKWQFPGSWFDWKFKPQ